MSLRRVDSAIAGRLLGRHVLRRAERQACLRDATAAGVADGERDAEIGDDRLAVVKQNVLGLEVAMDDAVRGARSRARPLLRRAMRSASSTGSCFSRSSRARSDSPSTNGMT